MIITAVDTNVLVDVYRADIVYGAVSSAALAICLREGIIVASDVVWAELRAIVPTKRLFYELVSDTGLQFQPLNSASAELAGITWQEYKRSGGTRERMAADFLIGAHATLQCDRLLTRDTGFCRLYFQQLTVLSPIEL